MTSWKHHHHDTRMFFVHKEWRIQIKTGGLSVLQFMQVRAIFCTLLNEQGLISKNHMKARTYPKVAKKLVRNPFPGNRHDDSMHTFLLQRGETRACEFTSSLNSWWNKTAQWLNRCHKARRRNKASTSCLTVTCAPEMPGPGQRPLAAGCLVHANPSSPEARL